MVDNKTDDREGEGMKCAEVRKERMKDARHGKRMTELNPTEPLRFTHHTQL